MELIRHEIDTIFNKALNMYSSDNQYGDAYANDTSMIYSTNDSHNSMMSGGLRNDEFNKAVVMMVKDDFVRNIDKYENAIEDLKINIGNYPYEERCAIESAVDFGLRNRINDDNIDELMPMIEKEYEVYKVIAHRIHFNEKDALKHMVERIPNAKYINANKYINAPLLEDSINKLPSRIKKVYVDFSDSFPDDINAFDDAVLSDINEVNKLGTKSTEQIYRFYPTNDSNGGVKCITGGDISKKAIEAYSLDSNDSVESVMKCSGSNCDMFKNGDNNGIYVPAFFYFDR